MKKSLFMAALMLSFGVVYAQAEPGAPSPDSPMEAQFVEEEDVNTALQAYLDSKGWTEGRNTKGDSYFVLVTGVGDVAAPPTHKSFIPSRMRAATKAMLDAKSNLATYLEQDIETAASFSTVEPPQDLEPSVEEELEMRKQQLNEFERQDNSICAKAINLIHTKLDNALADAGFDQSARKAKTQAEYDALQAKVKEIVGKDSFKQSIKASAATLISGLQAIYTVECKGAIGVVAVWSPLLAEMASSMTTGASVANRAPKRPIKEQIPTKADTLVNTFGVQQKIDENGALVLVSFAQEGAVSKRRQAEQNAYNKAQLQADGMIRNFAGEAVSTSSALEAAEETTDFGDYAPPDYRDQSSFESFQKAAGAKLKVNGVRTIHRWKAIHPVSGQTVYGIVRAWSPGEAAVARELKAKIETEAADGAAGRRTIPSASRSAKKAEAPRPTVDQEDYHVGGAAGDDDAF